MSQTDTIREVSECVGEIDPARVYTVEGCLTFAGMGPESLREARQSGVVKAYHSGRRIYYRGSELIAWLTRETK